MTFQLLRFGLIGVVGFLVDSGVLYALMACGLGVVSSRLLSFLCAVLATWLLNRRFTFRPHSQTSVASEGLAYLTAMSLGGLLNISTFAVIMATFAYHPLLPALGVAAGSLVGMLVNFIGAKWWVYRAPNHALRWQLRGRDLAALAVLQLLFWSGICNHFELPGLYMDAVNPDYLAARTLNTALHNPVFAMPTVFVPLLGNLYHGMQNYYVGLPIFAVMGFNLLALRIAQALFGAATVSMLYAVAYRATRSRLLGFLAALGLATDVAFIASFRTQFYIILAGAFWLLCAVYCALPSRSTAPSRRQIVGSGVFFGLAIYAYFVYLFFLPMVLLCALQNTRSWRTIASWGLGLMIGVLPYVIGYLSLTVALGGLEPTLVWLKQTVTGLAPLSAKLTFLESLANSFRNVRFAVQNTGNELMIFGASPPLLWPQIKLWALGASLLWVAVWHFKTRLVGTEPKASAQQSLLTPGQLVWLPVSYFGISLLFGNRLWVHHFSVLLPLLYLMAALALSPALQVPPSWLRPRFLRAGMLALIAVMAGANLQQQSNFFARLEQTGGVGKMSDSINRMAEDARTAPEYVVYIFPEWGFFMPFSFLTANQRPYEVELSTAVLYKHAQLGHELRIAYWSAADDEKYQQILAEHGFRLIEITTYFQRDLQPAFRLMRVKP